MIRIVDFSKYSSFKIGPTIEVELIDKNSKNIEGTIIGGANNLLISNNPPKLYMLSKDYDYIKLSNNYLTIGGATPSGKIFSFCKKNNLGGLEYLSKLPGTLGGLIKMNAGMKEYEIFNYLKSININKEEFKKEEINYGYRYAKIQNTIYEATFEIETEFDSTKLDLFTNMRKNQPQGFSAGSVFKNPQNFSAGWLIEQCGLKGLIKGDIEISPLHANFFINKGNGKYEDVIYLIELAKEKVYNKFKTILDLEIDCI